MATLNYRFILYSVYDLGVYDSTTHNRGKTDSKQAYVGNKTK